MTRGLNVPYFPNPPGQYDQRHMQQLVQSFSLFARQVQTPGPWRATELTLTQETGNVDYGTLSWNIDEETVDLTMGNGITQQIGFETYMRAENDTGVSIPEGTVVGFAGVNGEIKVAPYIADGTIPELYFVGVTTSEIPDNEVRPVTIYGKVRRLDTTGASVSETWAVGDILYASPTTAGAFTNVRPTAPDAVIVVAAVLVVSATDGEIMVRPTIPIGLDYGSFASTVDQTLSATNTATTVTFNVTEISNGISLGSPASRLVAADSGFYQVAFSAQLTSSSSSAKNIYFWLKKGTTNVADTTRAVTLSANSAFFPFSVVYDVSLLAGEYVEVMWAADSTDVRLDAVAASSFAPAAPSALVAVTQIQL
jgi:hypothetical protein